MSPDPELNPDKVGRNLFFLRVVFHRGTVRELARATGCTDSAIRHYEAGRYLPGLAKGNLLAHALGLPEVSFLWGDLSSLEGWGGFAEAWEAARATGGRHWRHALELRIVKAGPSWGSR